MSSPLETKLTLFCWHYPLIKYNLSAFVERLRKERERWQFMYDTVAQKMSVKCWNWTQGDKGYVKEGLVTNSDGFLWRWAGNAPTPDLVVSEFWRWRGRTDLASAYVLRPLNRLVLDFEVWQRSDEWVEFQKYTGLVFVRGDLESEGRSQDHQLS